MPSNYPIFKAIFGLIRKVIYINFENFSIEFT